MLSNLINKIIKAVRLQNGLILIFQLFKLINISIFFILSFAFWLSFIDFPDIGKGLIWLIYFIWLVSFIWEYIKNYVQSFFPNDLLIVEWLLQLADLHPELNILLSAFQLEKKYQRSGKPILKSAYLQKIEQFSFPEIRIQSPAFKKQFFIFSLWIMCGSILMVLNNDVFNRSIADLFFIKSNTAEATNHRVKFDKENYRSLEKDTLLITGKAFGFSSSQHLSLKLNSLEFRFHQNYIIPSPDGIFKSRLVLPKGKYLALIKLISFDNTTDATDTAQIEVLEKPFIKYYNLTVSPPSYTSLNRYVQKDRGNLVLLPGSRVYIKGVANKEIKKAQIGLNKNRFYQLKKSANHFSGHFTVRSDSLWEINIVDFDSLSFNTRPAFTINYLQDSPPSIKLNEPKGDIKLFDIDHLPLAYTIEDDYGISRVIIKYRVIRPGIFSEEFQELTIGENERDLPKQKQYRWDLSSLGVFAGEKIEYLLGAWDNDDINGFNYAQTDTYRIYIPSLFENIISEQQQNMDIDNQLQKISKMADMIKKKMEDLHRKLKQKEKFDFKLKSESRENLKDQNQLYNEMEKLSKKIDEKLAELEKKDAINEETVEKYQEIQRMLQNILPPEIREKLQKMQDLLEKEDAKNFSKELDDFDKEKFAEEIDRIHELLKKMEKEQRLNDLKNALFNLSEDQNQVSDSLQMNKWTQAEQKETQINNNFDAVKSLMKLVELDLKNSQVKGLAEGQQKLSKANRDSLKKEIDALEKSISKRVENAGEKSNVLSQTFSSLAGDMKQMQQQYQKQNKDAIVDKLDNILTQTYNLSSEQEQNSLQTKKINAFSHTQLKLSKRQAQLARQLEKLKKELIDIGNETFLLQSGVFARAEKARIKMLEAAEQLSQKRVVSARNFQNQAMIETNLLYYQLLESMNNVQNSQSGSGAESFMQMMEQLSAAQGKLNNAGMQLLQGGGGSPEDLQSLGARQKAIKEALQEAMENSGSSGTSGRMNEVVDEMDKISKLLDNGRLDAKIIGRQQKVFDRMLDSQKSLRQKEKSKKRESEKAKPYLVIKPREVENREVEIMWENYYRKLLKQRFQDQTLKQMRQYYEKID